VATSQVTGAGGGGGAGMTEKSPLRTSHDSPLYAECKPPATSYVLLRPGNTAAVLDVPPGSPASSDRGAAGPPRGGAAVRRRSSLSDLRALTDRLERLGAVDAARSLTATSSADAVAWSSVTHRGCCVALPHSGRWNSLARTQCRNKADQPLTRYTLNAP